MIASFSTWQHALASVPVLVKVLGSLALILAFNSLTRRLFLSIAAGTLLLAVWSGHSASAMLHIGGTRLLSAGNLSLLVIVFQVIWLSLQMSRTGLMTELVGAVRARISRRRAIAVLPAIIGMLPMPGGAIFSAPLVADCDPQSSLSPLLKTRINYWFRHIWEYWWPLYPGVLLAIEITGLEIWQFILIELPLTLLAVGCGVFFLLRKIDDGAETDEAGRVQKDRPGASLFRLTSPITVVVCIYALMRVAWPAAAALNRYLPMMVGLAAGSLLLQIERPLPAAVWKQIFSARKTVVMAALVAAVRVYGAFIEAQLPTGELLVSVMRDELASWHMPVLAVIVVIPFVSGLATGLAVGFVGASFPIVISLLGESPSLSDLVPVTVLAYGCGYVGMILSPVHICLIVSNEHFRTQVLHSLRGLLKPAAALLAGVLLYYFVLQWVFR
jgi:integral membrane protein (TIGR00529 family)